jgi:hypothetical protein
VPLLMIFVFEEVAKYLEFCKTSHFSTTAKAPWSRIVLNCLSWRLFSTFIPRTSGMSPHVFSLVGSFS